MYIIDSCLEKLRQKNYVCNQPNYHTVCKKPIVDRGLLTHDDYLKMLSTPKGYKWHGITSYDDQNRQGNENNGVHGKKKWTNAYQQKVYNGKNSSTGKKIDKNFINKQNQKEFDDNLNANTNKLENVLNTKLQEKNYISKLKHKDKNNSVKNLNKTQEKNYISKLKHKDKNNSVKNLNKTQEKNYISKLKHKDENNSVDNLNKIQENNYISELKHKDENNSVENLNKIQESKKLDILMKKEQQWLQSEKKRKREEKNKKLKSALQNKQNIQDEYKKKMEEKIKLKMKRKEILIEKRRKQKSEKENKENAKRQALFEIEIFKQRAELRKQVEKHLRLKALKLEAERIIEEEETWRNKINQAYALKMSNTFNLKHHKLSNENIRDRNCMDKTNKEKFTKYTNTLLNAVKQNNLVFDPGNLMKSIIREELDVTEKNRLKFYLWVLLKS